ncbi:MAG: rRNA maturation RNase YbeY [Lentisphaerae bacterium GWF2_45_14]|nr:MAG: rRNA maturation RNase YbeY [Lentisphaerae bacterium GWF2_45_14]
MNSLLLQAAALCLPEEKDRTFEIDFHFLTSSEMAEINRKHVGHDGITDVICFNYPEGMAIPGEQISNIDIFICPEAARKAAERPGRTYEGEILLYAVHGLLHAAGENDLEPEERKKMRRMERAVTRKLKRKFKLENLFRKEAEKA